MKLRTIIHSKEGRVIISVLLGLGLATFFRQVCKDKGCIVLEAVGEEEIKDKTYHQDDKCYKYSIEPTKCDRTKKTVSFA